MKAPEQISTVFVSSAGSLLLHLLDWVRLHKADVDEKAREVLQSESPAEHHDYWDVVSACSLLQNLHTDNSQHFTLHLGFIRQSVSHVLCLA